MEWLAEESRCDLVFPICHALDPAKQNTPKSIADDGAALAFSG